MEYFNRLVKKGKSWYHVEYIRSEKEKRNDTDAA